MVCVKRKIRAKVGFFRELSEKCVKKAVESSNFLYGYYVGNGSNHRAKTSDFMQ